MPKGQEKGAYVALEKLLQDAQISMDGIGEGKSKVKELFGPEMQRCMEFVTQREEKRRAASGELSIMADVLSQMLTEEQINKLLECVILKQSALMQEWLDELGDAEFAELTSRLKREDRLRKRGGELLG